MDKSLQDYHYRFAADLLGVPVPVVVAVARTEAPNGGFLSDGRVKILYEPHIFSRLTSRLYDEMYPEVSHPIPLYKRGGYGSYAEQWKRLNRAMALDVDSAIQSCSWGAFQVLGKHWQSLGYISPRAMMKAMENPAEQLLSFVRYCQANGADLALREEDWEMFFRVYNGPDWKSTGYDKKLMRELERAEAEYEAVLQ